MSTQDIINYLKVNDDPITGEQPTAEPLKAAASEGITQAGVRARD